jgi:hypothetical protein
MYIHYFNINVVGSSFLNRMTYISVLVGKSFPVEFVNFPYTKIERVRYRDKGDINSSLNVMATAFHSRFVCRIS